VVGDWVEVVEDPEELPTRMAAAETPEGVAYLF